MTLEELKEACASFHLELSQVMLAQFDVYADLLASWNQKMNLTAIVEKEEVIEKHFYDCLLPLAHIKLKGDIADVGSGAGFPGLVFAIVCPNCKFTLIEPTGKRCNFLNEVINRLQLQNVTVVNERSEDYVKDHRESFDVVTARAVANLSILSELCVPLIKQDGIFLSLKGKNGLEELEDAQKALTTLGIGKQEIFQDDLLDGSSRINLVLHKEKPTPKKYPRPYGQIKKKPL